MSWIISVTFFLKMGIKALLDEFENIITRDKSKKNHDAILDDLKLAIKNTALQTHKWDEKALDSLRIIQLNALEDRSVPDKQSWEAAVGFMDSVLRQRLNESAYSFKFISFLTDQCN
jgi:optic atrophy protein 1